MSDNNMGSPSTGGMVTIVYILYLVGLVVGITSIVGIIMAYVNRDSGPAWCQSHFRLQIRTFWIAILYSVIGGLLAFVGIGWFLLLAVVVWWIVRCAKGLKFASATQPYPNPASWLW